jgi:phosphohistidine phosphatase
MKILLLLRHAKSDWDDPTLDDIDRPLNARGLKDAPRMGKLLRKQELLPDLALCSDAKRARATLELVAEESGYQGEIRYTRDLYAAPADAFLEALSVLPGEYKSVMLVGHNPSLEELLYKLTGQRQPLSTAALAQVRLLIESWQELGAQTRGELVHIWRPKEI